MVERRKRIGDGEIDTVMGLVAFKPPVKDDGDEDDEIAALKKQVRHAMAVLEQGKPVAAFNLLKRIVHD